MLNGLDFLASLEFFGIKLGLDQTREVFRRMGDPAKDLRFIHVAGSNGKGSVCALLESALRHAGFKTGFYSSPHLVTVGERFRINGIPATDEMVENCVNRLRPVVDAMSEDGMKVTYFEATTVIAATLFAEAGVDIVLWETGMGGRLDSTNIVTPLASVITGISLEHADRLGGTLEKIAFEKAGIIKPGVPVYCAETTPDAAKAVIRARAEECAAPFTLSQKTIPGNCTGTLQYFTLKDGTALATPLMGPHQRGNAALAWAVLQGLAPVLDIDLAKAVEGMRSTRWDVRFQVFPERGLILDAAHNPEGIHALAATLKEHYPGRKFHFLFGAFSDKDTASGLAELADLALSFRFIHMETDRASRTFEELSAELKGICPVSCDTMTLEDALSSVYPDGELRVLCGSLHLCGDALAILNKSTAKNGTEP